MKARSSIASSLWRSIFAALLGASLLTFMALYTIGRAERVAAFEQDLFDDLRTIANITQVYPDDDLYVNVEPETLIAFQAGGTRFFQVWDAASGELLDQSPSLEAMKHLWPHPADVSTTPRRIEARLPDGREVSLLHQERAAHWGLDQAMLNRTGLTINNRQVQLLVGRARSELTESLWPLALACGAGALLLPVLVAALLIALLPPALRPLRELSDAVARRAPESTEPFPIGTAREVQPIALRLNELMARIDDQRQRERRFLADTAHELRNPLAELHAMADVALLPGADTTQHAGTFADMKQVTHRLAGLVEHLFRLARHARTATAVEAVCVHDVVDAAVRALASQAGARGVAWQRSGDARLHVTTDPVLLQALMLNLLGNVVAHARVGSQAWVQWAGGDNSTHIVVRNECAADPAAAALHLGHGLSIARTYAYAVSATLTAERTGDSFEVRVEFPAPTLALQGTQASPIAATV